jgi:multidrug efflux pump subunit AcrA (membrane-fusion protein)
VDQATRTMITEVDVSNPAGVILPGMYAEVSVQSKQHDGVLTAPVEAIERAGSAARVYTVDKAGVIRIVPVQIGVEDAARAEIVSGLQEADLVITGRRSGLNAGDRVRAKAAGSEE